MEKIKDDNELYDLVYDRLYNELFLKLKIEKETERLSRSKSTVLKLLYLYYQVCDGRYTDQKIAYTSDSRNHFQRFFDSVNKKDLKEINFQINELYRLKDESQEMNIYKMIIDDILEQQLFVSENPDFNNIIFSYTKDVESILRKKGYLSMGTLDKLRNLLENIIEMNNAANRESVFENIYLNIVDLIAYSNSNPISLDYFYEIDKTGNKVADLLDALEIGDYKTTYDLLDSDNSLEFNGINKTKLNILKKLLVKIDKSSEFAKTHVDNIISLVNQGLYTEAFNHYLTNNVDLTPEAVAILLLGMEEEKQNKLIK